MSEGGLACAKCGAAWAGGKPGFRATCDKCGAWLHACVNCRHYEPSVYHQCRESATAEYVGDKEGGNFCESFAARTGSRPGPKLRSRAEIEKLFGGSA